jgi:Fe-Mn family superoxide dismutase
MTQEAHWDRRQIIAAGLGASLVSPTQISLRETRHGPPPEYAARDFSGLIGMEGFSEAALKDHFALYQGYVKNTNTCLQLLAEAGKTNQLAAPGTAEVRRRFGWEWNGMRLHELYFENLGGKDPLDPKSDLATALKESFGSLEAWTADFKGTGKQRGIGWAALVYDHWSKRLMNTWISEHDGGHLGACPILLIMDVFEHAFIRDYGLARADYIEAFFKNIQWDVVEKRLG